MSTNPPTQGRATKAETGRSCPYCRFPLKEKDQITFCGVCESAHHSDCWDENGGCSVVACAGGPQEADASSAPPPPPRNAPPPPPRHGPPSTPPPSRETPQSHVPPRVPNQGKKQKVTIEPDPVARRSPAGTNPPRPEPESSPKTRKSTDDKPLMIAGVVVLIAAVVGIVLIAQSFSGSNNAPTTQASGTDETSGSSSTASDAGGTSSGGGSSGSVNKPDKNGKFPNELNSTIVADITQLIRSFHTNLKDGNLETAWSQLSERKRSQIENDVYWDGPTAQSNYGEPQFPDGYSSWVPDQVDLGASIDPSGAKVKLIQPSYPDDGVMSIRVSNMPYFGTKDCDTWKGVTWVRYERGRWTYEPGYKVTRARDNYWGQSSRSGQALGNNCG